MNNKILITGSGGFVGQNLYKLLQTDFRVFGIGKNRQQFVDSVVDISKTGEFVEVLERYNPDQIVHLAALSNVEKCETERKLADEQNILPVETMTQWAKNSGKRIIFISSDYVYDGGKGNFSELDPENPIQYYGEKKLEGERIVSSLEKYAILRPTVIYGWDEDGMNFFMQLYRKQKSKETMKVPTDQISNPTSVLDLCRLIKKVVERYDTVGKYIATGNESINRYEFALKICELMNWDKQLVVPVETKELGQKAKRPLNNSTINKLVAHEFGYLFNSIENNLKVIKKQIE